MKKYRFTIDVLETENQIDIHVELDDNDRRERLPDAIVAHVLIVFANFLSGNYDLTESSKPL